MSDLHRLLKLYEGRPAAVAGRGPDPVNRPMIRHWCEALGDTGPAYRGEDAVAPATMLQVWTMPGLGGPAARSPALAEVLALLDGAGFTAVVATDCEQEYLRPLRLGDEITFDSVIESVSPRKTTRLGAGHFLTRRTEIRVADELVGTQRFRIFKYAPASRISRPAERPDEHRAERPQPVVNRDNAGFWEGVTAHRLLIQQCEDCAEPRFPWLPGCAHCGSPRWTAVDASGAGTVHACVVVHHPPAPGFEPPYAVALVELAEGVRMVSNITGAEPGAVHIGMPVELEFLQVGEGRELPVFRPREGSA